MGALVVERNGAGVVVRSADTQVAGAGMAARHAADDSRARVFIDHTALEAFDQLEHEVLADLQTQLRPGDSGPMPGIRLLVGRSGLAGPDGRAPLAARLSERLNVEVVAPDGNLLMLPGGELFSVGEATGWVGFRPGKHKTHTGPRHPIPSWQGPLSETLRSRAADPRISITSIPAGLWVRAAGAVMRPMSDMAYGVPVSGARLAIVVGAPGEEQPGLEALAGLVAALPGKLRQTLGLICYGPEPDPARPLAQRLADLLGIPVHCCHAVPQYLPDGAKTWKSLDAAGQRAWLPFVLESLHRPGVPPLPRNWVQPLPGMVGAGVGAYWLQDGWLVDVLPSGLLVRPVRTPVDPVASRLATDPEVVNLVVTAAAGPPPGRVLTTVERMVRLLPAETRARLRLVATPHAAPGYLAGLGRALSLGVHVLTASGPGPAVIPAASVTGGEAHPWDSSATEVLPVVTDLPVASASVVPPDSAAIDPPAVAAGPIPAAANPRLVAAEPAPAAIRPLPVAAGHGPAATGNPPEPVAAGPAPEPPAHPDVRFRPSVHVAIDADGRMRPSGDGWRDGGAATTRDPEGEPDSAGPGSPRGNAPAEDEPATELSTPATAPAAGGGLAALPVTTASVQVPIFAPAVPPRMGPKSAEPPAKPVAEAAESADQTTGAPEPSEPAAANLAAANPAAASAGPVATAVRAPIGSSRQSLVDQPADRGLSALGSAVERERSRVAEPAVAEHRPAAAAPGPPAVVPTSTAADVYATLAPKPATAEPEATPRPVAISGTAATPGTAVVAADPTVAQESAAATEPADAVADQVPDPAPAPGIAAAEQAAEAEPQHDSGPARPLMLADHVGTDAERQQFRKSLGWRYDAATRAVSRLLAERPGLRGGGSVDDAMMTELAAIRVFATSDQVEVVEAIRAGDASVHFPYISCLVGGLRRLPSLQGVVVRGGPDIATGAGDYVVGTELFEPAPMAGASDPTAAVPGAVEVLIWSVTARRLGGLTEETAVADVMFLPATVFRVLAVDVDAECPRVLLAETGKQRSEEARQRHDDRILARLTAAAKARDGLPAAVFSDADRSRFAFLPGEPSNPFEIPEPGSAR
ncbi:hypothetical protein SAMN05216215_103539 [Saccharopolyspora shandongensis]|uniref:Uncharacterized protein n=1 Tax=Saccharopolyspora shandongensis TaxID=418495 RepID=A0A1H3MS99_9PSEU|nr:hypothetical protein [Saccharopolyspora shandongensis]SDY79562.1 hypothetical protein SAMN05216215_103539 [Saccharopolyspora shandongensis]